MQIQNTQMRTDSTCVKLKVCFKLVILKCFRIFLGKFTRTLEVIHGVLNIILTFLCLQSCKIQFFFVPFSIKLSLKKLFLKRSEGKRK